MPTGYRMLPGGDLEHSHIPSVPQNSEEPKLEDFIYTEPQPGGIFLQGDETPPGRHRKQQENTRISAFLPESIELRFLGDNDIDLDN